MSEPHPESIPDKTLTYLPWLVAVALFMENLDATIVNTAVPTMSASFGVLPLSLKGVLTSYTLSLAVFIPISGWMADRFGTKAIFNWATGIFTVGSLCCGLSTNVPMLVASRIMQGIGGAMMTPVGRLAMVRTFPRSELLRAMNFVVVPALIGPMVGPFVGGVIVHWLHWRLIFFVNLPFGLLGIWMIHRYMPDFRDVKVAKLDRVGFVLFGVGIALLSYVMEIFGEHSLPLGPLALMLAASLILLGWYGWHARHTESPLLNLRLFRVRTFRVSVVGGFVTRIGIGGMPFLLPLLYQIGLGYPAWQAGLFTVPTALAAIGLKLASRPLLSRFGHRTVLISNTVLLGLNITMFRFVEQGTPVWGIVLLGFVQGFIASLQFTSMNTLAYADVADSQSSQATSIASTSQQMSLSFGVAFGALLAAWFLGHVDRTDPVQTVAALHKAFVAMGVLTIVSSATFWGLKSTDGNNVSNRRTEPAPTPAEAKEAAASV